MMHPIPSLDELIDLVTQTLKHWQQKERLNALPVNLAHVRRAALRSGKTHLEEWQLLLLHAMETMATTFPNDAYLLKRRFIEGLTVEAMTYEVSLSDAAFFRKQSAAQMHLAQQVELLLQQDEQRERERLEARLEPATYNNLFGVTATLSGLEQVLTRQDEPWIVAITGMGGIGKTTLADAFLRRTLAQRWFDEIGWVTARQTSLSLIGELRTLWQDDQAEQAVEHLVYALAKQLFAQSDAAALQLPWPQLSALLKTRLKRLPHLIVIDNLETVSDIESLVPTLRQWSNPTKFFLTSRKTMHQAADIYHITAAELNEVDALRLVRQEAMTRNLPHVVTASDDELRPIYDVVGGNPLALRLVTGQLHIDPLPKVLYELREASGQQAQALYSYIYRRAWELLNESERMTLLAMPMLDPQGGSFDMLTSICQRMSKREVDKALKKLISLSLVDCRVGLYESRYSLHSLTRAFLHKQVAHWSGTIDSEE